MLNDKGGYALILLVAALLAGHAAYWFVSGTFRTHSEARNIAVILQLIASVAVGIGAFNRSRQPR